MSRDVDSFECIVQVPVDVVLAENSAFRQQLDAYKRREEELTKEVC